MRRLCLCTIFFLCACQEGRVEFVEVCQDHAVLSQETTVSLIQSIDDELETATDETDRQGLQDLRERLLFLDKQATVINKYVHSTYVDRDLLVELIRAKIKKEQ